MMATTFNPGVYQARITTWGLGESKIKNTPTFILRFDVLGKINPNDPTGPLMACPNYERTIYKAITKNTVEFLSEDLKQLGYDKPSFRYLDPQADNAHDFSGQEITVRCDHDEYKGKLKEQWNLHRNTGSKEIEPLDNKRIRELDALFGKSLRLTSKDAPAKTGSAEVAAQPVESTAPSDEIPF